MRYTIPDGVYPTMLTPYTNDNQVDYDGLAELVEWYRPGCCRLVCCLSVQ